MNLEDWRVVIDYWLGQDKDIRHMNVPPEVAAQLGIELPKEKDMTEETTAQHEPAGLKWKKKKYFDGSKCGLKDCSKAPDGYLCDTKPTKGNANGRIWFGPACNKCIQKTNPQMTATLLEDLAFQRNGASDLALVLDIEVGDVMKRLEAAGVDENGNSLNPTPNTADDPKETPGLDSAQGAALVQVVPEAITIPTQTLAAAMQEAQGVLGFLGTFHVMDQDGMNNAAGWLQEVKAKWTEIEEMRTANTQPLREKLKEVQAHFKPAQDLLVQAEGILKQKIAEGSARAAEAQQQALLAAQNAHQAGDVQATGIAAQAAAAADVALPASVNMRRIIRFEIVDPTQLPGDYWSPDNNKIQAAINQGNYQIPGVRIWEDPIVASTRAPS